MELAALRVRYRQKVGLLHEELDELEAAIGEAELALITGEMVSRDGGSDEQHSPRRRARLRRA